MRVRWGGVAVIFFDRFSSGRHEKRNGGRDFASDKTKHSGGSRAGAKADVSTSNISDVIAKIIFKNTYKNLSAELKTVSEKLVT